MGMYMRKTSPVEAIQWTGDNLKEVIAIIGKHERFDEWFPGGWDEYEARVKADGNTVKFFRGYAVFTLPLNTWFLKSPPDGHIFWMDDDRFQAEWQTA